MIQIEITIRDLLPSISGQIRICVYGDGPYDIMTRKLVYKGNKYNIPLRLQKLPVGYITSHDNEYMEIGAIE